MSITDKQHCSNLYERATKNDNEARKQLEEIVEKEPDNVHALLLLGKLKYEHIDPAQKEAIDLFEKAAKLNNPAGFYNLAMAVSNNVDKAKNLYKGLQLNKKLKYPDTYKKLEEELLALARDADPNIQCILGNAYYNGYLGSAEITNATIHYQNAAKQNHEEARFMLVQCQAMTAKNDIATLVRQYKEIASKNGAFSKKALGEIESLHELYPNNVVITNAYAECLHHGWGQSIDHEKGFQLYRESAKLGDNEALLKTAVCYENGIGTEQDIDKVVGIYNAILCHDPKNQNNFIRLKNLEKKFPNHGALLKHIGYWFETGIVGTENKFDLAAEYYQRAVENGSMSAAYNLGLMYYHGTIKRNYTKAFHYIAMSFRNIPKQFPEKDASDILRTVVSIERNNLEILQEFIHLLADGILQVKPNDVNVLLASAERNDAEINYYLSRCYAKGIAVRKDERRAVELLFKVINSNNNFNQLAFNALKELARNASDIVAKGFAYNNLGLCYENGFGNVTKNLDFALLAYQQAVRLNDPFGNYNLGNIYSDQTNKHSNLSEAVLCYRRAYNGEFNKDFNMRKQVISAIRKLANDNPNDFGAAKLFIDYGKGSSSLQSEDLSVLKQLLQSTDPDIRYELGEWYQNNLPNTAIECFKFAIAKNPEKYRPNSGDRTLKQDAYLQCLIEKQLSPRKEDIPLLESKAVESKYAVNLVLADIWKQGISGEINLKKASGYYLQCVLRSPTHGNLALVELKKLADENPTAGAILGNLGTAFQNISVATMLDYYQKGHKVRDSFSAHNLGCLYHDGRGVTKDFDLAAKYFYDSMKFGHFDFSVESVKEGRRQLEYLYDKYSDKVEVSVIYAKYLMKKPNADYKLAEAILRKLAGKNHAEANYQLAKCYERSPEADFNHAAIHYGKSAKLNVTNPRSEEAVGKLLKLANNHSESFDAFHQLGICYAKEYGVQLNKDIALEYFYQAEEKLYHAIEGNAFYDLELNDKLIQLDSIYASIVTALRESLIKKLNSKTELLDPDQQKTYDYILRLLQTTTHPYFDIYRFVKKFEKYSATTPMLPIMLKIPMAAKLNKLTIKMHQIKDYLDKTKELLVLVQNDLSAKWRKGRFFNPDFATNAHQFFELFEEQTEEKGTELKTICSLYKGIRRLLEQNKDETSQDIKLFCKKWSKMFAHRKFTPGNDIVNAYRSDMKFPPVLTALPDSSATQKPLTQTEPMLTAWQGPGFTPPFAQAETLAQAAPLQQTTALPQQTTAKVLTGLQSVASKTPALQQPVLGQPVLGEHELRPVLGECLLNVPVSVEPVLKQSALGESLRQPALKQPALGEPLRQAVLKQPVLKEPITHPVLKKAVRHPLLKASAAKAKQTTAELVAKCPKIPTSNSFVSDLYVFPDVARDKLGEVRKEDDLVPCLG